MSHHALPTGFAGLGIFADLNDEERAAIEAELEPMPLSRGDVLVRQGDEADALYVVISGRFDVRGEGRSQPVAEIGPGSPIGEIAFLAGGQRTAIMRGIVYPGTFRPLNDTSMPYTRFRTLTPRVSPS